ncbi:MAG: hypothetical protein JWP87_3412 [Labilithrix sp.]|nr:hypothetical protein [Labilithrix sp.]
MPRKPASSNAEGAPSDLVYAATDASRRGSSAVAMFQLFSVPLLVGLVLSQISTPTVALVGMIAAAAGGVWWWRRAPHAGGVVLRVEGGDLVVLSANEKHEKERIALADLDVVLDTKVIQRVQEGGSAIPAMRFIDATVGPELDTQRIVVVGRGKHTKRFPLTDAYVAHMDSVEWFGKIRVFLRKNGWTPGDERAPESVPESE